MQKIYYQQDCNLAKLNGKTVAIIGYGSQGHAHALNLKDSGVNVIVGLYQGSKSWAKAEQQGLTVMTAAEAAAIYRAKVIDYNPDTLCVEVTGEPSKVNAFINVMRPLGIIELCRTGVVALERGTALTDVEVVIAD